MRKIDQNRASPIRVLFIGNSYTYYNDMPSILADLARTAKDFCLIETHAVSFPWGPHGGRQALEPN